MEDKSAPQEGPREGAAPASPGAGPNSPLQAANKRDAPPKAEAPQKYFRVAAQEDTLEAPGRHRPRGVEPQERQAAGRLVRLPSVPVRRVVLSPRP